METLTLPNDVLLGEVSGMLREGKRVVIRTKGNSMLPFIRGDRDSVELVMADDVSAGDVVLAYLPDRRYVLHRVIGIDAGRVTLMGDGNIAGTECCSLDALCGKVTCIVRENGDRVDCQNTKYLRRVRMWRRLKPMRRYLLAIYRRVAL